MGHQGQGNVFTGTAAEGKWPVMKTWIVFCIPRRENFSASDNFREHFDIFLWLQECSSVRPLCLERVQKMLWGRLYFLELLSMMPAYKNSPSSYPGLTSLYPCGIFASVLPRHWCAVGYQRVLKSLWCRVPSVPDGTHYVDLVIWNPQVLTYASWLERRIHMHPNMPGVDESDMTVASLLEMWYDATMPSEHSLVNQVHSFTRLQKLIWCRAHLYNRYRIAQLRCLFVLSNYALLPVRD